MRIKQYPALKYAAVEADMHDAIPKIEEEHVRLSIPSERDIQPELFQAGYTLADRTIEVKVPLERNKVDFAKFCRMSVTLEQADKEQVYELALKNFGSDYRFLVSFSEHRAELYQGILKQWIAEQTDIFICRYKGKLAGFADVRLQEEYAGAPFIYLAAVDEMYRASGMAMSLYAFVFRYMKEQGYKYAYGRISSKNMAVMNLYTSFGAMFAKPYDIYIKG